jgi:hypothetical protein
MVFKLVFFYDDCLCCKQLFFNLEKSEGPRPVMVSRSRAGFTLNIIDTPGLIEGGYINDMALDIIKRYALMSDM